MTVGELRELLEPYPAEWLVLRGDNSGGYEAINQPRQEEVTDALSSDRQSVEVVIVE